MENPARRTAFEALVELAASPDYVDRADAGRCLASFAELPEARRPLERLVLDPENTYVTLVTAEALLRRKGRPGLVILAAATVCVDDSQLDRIGDAIADVLGMFYVDLAAATRECQALTDGDDAAVRPGAAVLLSMFAEVKPVLNPA